MTKTLLLDYGSGGRASQRLINELFLEQFDNPILRTLDDAARLELSGPIAMSTDGYTVTPLFFPGGNIGTLAVHVAGNKAAGFVSEMADKQTVLQGKLEIGHFSASVSGNVVFENVVWTAPDGKKLAEVPEMNVSANLFDILKGSFGINSINSISIEKPQFAVNYTDKDGLDIINYINFSDKDDETPTEFRGMVEITDGALALDMNGQKLDFSNV